MQVKNEELRTAREVAREINSILDLLNQKDLEKVVITGRDGKMRGVIITPETWDNFPLDEDFQPR
jgi:hypothetical protein